MANVTFTRKCVCVCVKCVCIYIYIYIYISEHKKNAHNDGNIAQPLKWHLETLFLAINSALASPQMLDR